MQQQHYGMLFLTMGWIIQNMVMILEKYWQYIFSKNTFTSVLSLFYLFFLSSLYLVLHKVVCFPLINNVYIHIMSNFIFTSNFSIFLVNIVLFIFVAALCVAHDEALYNCLLLFIEVVICVLYLDALLFNIYCYPYYQ